ncbi:MAG: hypothetical protein C0508_27320 [Cyanobacteria bacterium PR.023]|nr:hypothetical protein [Cyanobacteria bacterium PR.023]
MSETDQKSATTNNEASNSSGTELEQLKARHDAVHHMPTSTNTAGGLTARGKSLEDDWIRRHEKEQAEAAKAKEEKGKKGNK